MSTNPMMAESYERQNFTNTWRSDCDTACGTG
jgi:hypothetical protein